jgi:hypothetical protein
MAISKQKFGGTKARIPRIRAPEAPDFKGDTDELLEVGHVEETPESRASLDSYLQLAWAEADDVLQKEQAPPNKFKQLKNHIKKTQALLKKLEGFPATRNIGCGLCQVGDSTVSTATVQEMIFGGTLRVPRNAPPPGFSIPPNGTLAAINRHRALDSLLRDIARYEPKRKRGGQKSFVKRAIIARAAHFFRQHSSVEPTSYTDGPFVQFCTRFYEVVTGASRSSSGLEKLLKENVKKSRPRDLDI